jgi:predicted GNAT family N-acyltransferase
MRSDDRRVMIRPIASSDTRPLRQLALRPHQALADLGYDGDDAEGTFHLGAFAGDRLVGVISVYRQAHPAHAHPVPYRIRGMATHPDVRGTGLGGRLLAAALERCGGGTHIWCNARTPACGFYERYGFSRRGDEFDLPGIGPHFYMERQL